MHTLDTVSSSDKAGKKFAARLDTNLVVKGKVAAAAGSKVYGRVESSRSAGRAFGQSKLALRAIANARAKRIRQSWCFTPCCSGYQVLVSRGMTLTVAELARAPIIELRYLPWYFAR